MILYSLWLAAFLQFLPLTRGAEPVIPNFAAAAMRSNMQQFIDATGPNRSVVEAGHAAAIVYLKRLFYQIAKESGGNVSLFHLPGHLPSLNAWTVAAAVNDFVIEAIGKTVSRVTGS